MFPLRQADVEIYSNEPHGLIIEKFLSQKVVRYYNNPLGHVTVWRDVVLGRDGNTYTIERHLMAPYR